MQEPNKKSGFIKLIILIVVVLVLLGYFGFNVKDIIDSPMVSGNLHYAWGLTVTLWNKYLSVPFNFIWDKIIVDIFWNNISTAIDKASHSLN